MLGPDPQELATAADKLELAELVPLLAVIAKKVSSHRGENQGFVPKEVFPLILSIAGQYTCIEYAPRIVDESGNTKGYLLKKRNADAEQGWERQFQIPGVAVVASPDKDMMKIAQDRLKDECNFRDWSEQDSIKIKAAGIEAHYEEERGANCLTLVMTLDIPESDLGTLSNKDEWQVFENEQLNDQSIIGHHQKTLAWLNKAGRQEFELVDLRNA